MLILTLSAVLLSSLRWKLCLWLRLPRWWQLWLWVQGRLRSVAGLRMLG